MTESTNTTRTITEDEFIEEFEPETDKDGNLYVQRYRYGDDAAIIDKAIKENRLWTAVENDSWWEILQGYHFVNRQYHIVCAKPYRDDENILIKPERMGPDLYVGDIISAYDEVDDVFVYDHHGNLLAESGTIPEDTEGEVTELLGDGWDDENYMVVATFSWEEDGIARTATARFMEPYEFEHVSSKFWNTNHTTPLENK